MNRADYIFLTFIIVVLSLFAVYSDYVDNTEKWDLLIVAPHPDDETLCCSGIMIQALQAGKKVGVVVLTNGDGYPLAASHLTNVEVNNLTVQEFFTLASARQQWLTRSLSLIGFNQENIYFLSYPDGKLNDIYLAGNDFIHLNEFTKKNQTYKAAFDNYNHSERGYNAKYTKANITNNLRDIILDKAPKEIYVSSAFDSHGDHKAAYSFVRDATDKAFYQGDIYTYLIHYGNHQDWPVPRQFDLSQKFAPMSFTNNSKSSISWPPSKRVPLTPIETQTKLMMINQFKLEVEMDKEFVHAFAKSEEIFWLSNPITSLAYETID